MSHPRPAGVPDPRHANLTVEEFVVAVLDRMQSSEGRPSPFYRLRELCPPFSRTWVKARIADGSLKAGRLNGLTLISAASLDRLLEQIEWRENG